ncbi:hypothetical protein CBL_07376 [Carabus blaptoides fortunei]
MEAITIEENATRTENQVADELCDSAIVLWRKVKSVTATATVVSTNSNASFLSRTSKSSHPWTVNPNTSNIPIGKNMFSTGKQYQEKEKLKSMLFHECMLVLRAGYFVGHNRLDLRVYHPDLIQLLFKTDICYFPVISRELVYF